LELNNVDIYVSRSAEEVLSLYGLKQKLYTSQNNIMKKEGITFFSAGRFARGEYGLLVCAPASSNSVAKFVRGISDSLTTNLFSVAGKSRVKTIVLPTDTKEEIESLSPTGWVKVYPRKVDLDNVERLKEFENVIVVKSIEELKEALEKI